MNMEDIKNLRVMSLKDNTLMYLFNMEHMPRSKNKALGVTSRYPANRTMVEDSQEDMFEITGAICWQKTYFCLSCGRT